MHVGSGICACKDLECMPQQVLLCMHRTCDPDHSLPTLHALTLTLTLTLGAVVGPDAEAGGLMISSSVP